MTQLILYTSEDGQAQVQREATDKEFLTVQTRDASEASGHATSDQFRGVTKLIELGSGSKREVDHVGGCSTRRVENPPELLTIDHASRFAPTIHQH